MQINPLGSRPKADLKQLGQIKGWVRSAFQLPSETPVMVAELQCSEPGCPPVETVVAILDMPGQPRQHKIYKPMAEVTFQDINQLTESDQVSSHYQAEP